MSFCPLPLWTSLCIRLRFWVCLMIVSVWRVVIFSLGVLIFVRIFLPSVLTFLLMLLVISLLVLRPSSWPFVLLPFPSVSSSALPPPLPSAALPFSQPSAPLFSAPSSISLPSGSLLALQGWGVCASVVSSAPPGFPPLSAPSSLFSEPPPAFSLLCLQLLLCSLRLPLPSLPYLSGFVAPGWGSTLVASMGPPLVPGPQPSSFRPSTVSDPPLLSSASSSAPLSSASISSAAGPSGQCAKNGQS